LDFNEARDDWMTLASVNHSQLAPRQYLTNQPTASKHWRQYTDEVTVD